MEVLQAQTCSAVVSEKSAIVASEIEFIRRDVLRWAPAKRSFRTCTDPKIELTSYLAGNVALHDEDIPQLAIVRLAPPVQGAIGEAESTIRQAIAIDPSDGEEGPNDRMRAYAVFAQILQKQDKISDAQLYSNAVAAIRLSEHGDQLHKAGLYDRAFKTYREALDNAEQVIREWIATARELGRPIPEPKGRLLFA